jgi:uracil-DNA glycosylase
MPIGPKPTSADESLEGLAREIADCRQCPRLVDWREQVASEKRAAFKNSRYWGRPVAGFGDSDASIVVVGLAPAAHGGNRTGRVFTGDRSGDWLFASMHRCGLANQPTSTSVDDGLSLRNVWVTAAVKCAPPANKPTIAERDECVSRHLARELDLLKARRVFVCLGKFAYDVVCSALGPVDKKPFGHGVCVEGNEFTILCSYHPSQQNTFTGRLTESMLDSVFSRASQIAGGH